MSGTPAPLMWHNLRCTDGLSTAGPAPAAAGRTARSGCGCRRTAAAGRPPAAGPAGAAPPAPPATPGEQQTSYNLNVFLGWATRPTWITLPCAGIFVSAVVGIAPSNYWGGARPLAGGALSKHTYQGPPGGQPPDAILKLVVGLAPRRHRVCCSTEGLSRMCTVWVQSYASGLQQQVNCVASYKCKWCRCAGHKNGSKAHCCG